MKFSKGNVDLGQFWYTTFWVPDPPPLLSSNTSLGGRGGGGAQHWATGSRAVLLSTNCPFLGRPRGRHTVAGSGAGRRYIIEDGVIPPGICRGDGWQCGAVRVLNGQAKRLVPLGRMAVICTLNPPPHGSLPGAAQDLRDQVLPHLLHLMRLDPKVVLEGLNGLPAVGVLHEHAAARGAGGHPLAPADVPRVAQQQLEVVVVVRHRAHVVVVLAELPQRHGVRRSFVGPVLRELLVDVLGACGAAEDLRARGHDGGDAVGQ